MKSVTKYFKNLLSLMDKDVTRYVAAAVAAIIAFIMVGTYLVFKVRREEEKEKEREQRTATDSGSKKPVVRKRIGETDAYQGREFSLTFSAYDTTMSPNAYEISRMGSVALISRTFLYRIVCNAIE